MVLSPLCLNNKIFAVLELPNVIVNTSFMILDAFDPRVSPNENLIWILYYADGIIGVKYGMHKVLWWNVEEDDKSLCLLRAMPTQSEEYPSGNRIMGSVLHEEYMFSIHSNDEKHRETNMSYLLHAMRHDEMGQIKSKPSEYYFHVMYDFSKLPRLAIPSEWKDVFCLFSFSCVLQAAKSTSNQHRTRGTRCCRPRD
nr:hypothetical protein [Tanacetum cinerariifolium]